jgi:parvulin-like peptidyl-prolyl isomerase
MPASRERPRPGRDYEVAMIRRRGVRLLTATLLAGQLSLGCQAEEKPRVAAGFQPDFTTLLKLPGSESEVARAQKPGEAAKQKSLLEIGPDAPGSRDARGARIRATVNGDPILDEEVLAAAFQSMGGVRSEAERADIMNQKLNEIIDRELLMQDAVTKLNKRGGAKFLQELEKIAEREFDKQWLHRLMRANKISDERQFIRMLRDQGLPIELVRRQWVRNFISMEYARTRIEPSITRIGHEQIAEYYDSHPDDFKVQDSVVWQDLFIANARHPTPQAARQFAEVLLGRIRKGEDFARLAKEFDNGDSSSRENAEGIGTKRGQITPPEAEPVVFGLKQGEVGPLVEIETGYHIVRVVKRVYTGKRPFDDQTQKAIKEKLQNEVFQQEMRKLVNDLKRQAIIEVATEVK